MRTLFLMLLCTYLGIQSLFGQAIDIASLPFSYSQDFNALTNGTWTDNTTVAGWYSSETAYSSGTGSLGTGALYSFGSSGSSDRALGSVASAGTGTIHYAVQFSNNTGSDITSLRVEYTGEQWRETMDASAHVLSFSYQIDAAGINSGTWTSVTAMDFTALQSAAASDAAIIGNNAPNRTQKGQTLNITIANGETLWLRWEDINSSGADQALSVDDFSLSICDEVNEPTNHPTAFADAGGATTSSLSVSWTDATTGAALPDRYIIKGSTVSFADIADPVDGIEETTGTLVKIVNQAIGNQTFTGLDHSTTHYFKIYPYTCNSTDYKTDATIQQVSIATSVDPNPNTWINEFHYDDAGTDNNEFIEIVIEDPSSYTLSDFEVEVIKNDGTIQTSETVNNFTTGTVSGNFTIYSWLVGANNLPNGTSGITLSHSGTVIQFLSYEGTVTATAGNANGMTSTDIGLSETTSTPDGSSLELQSNTSGGNKYSDFYWTVSSGTNTISDVNSSGQSTLPVELTAFNGRTINGQLTLFWTTSSETDNYGFKVEKSNNGVDYEVIGFVAGSGTHNSPKNYSYNGFISSKSAYYRLKQIDFDGAFEYSSAIHIGSQAKRISISPNPYKSGDKLSLLLSDVRADDIINWSLYNASGARFGQRTDTSNELGASVQKLLEKVSPGIYYLTINSNKEHLVEKIVRN